MPALRRAARRDVQRPLRAFVVLLLAVLVAPVLTPAAAPAAQAVATAVVSQAALADPCGAGGNAITCENSKPGTPESVWDISGAGDDSIQGFSTDISVNVGSRIDFKIDTDASAYSITIYRTGYYGGDGARQIATVSPSATLPQHQPQCITDATTELYDCGNWAVSASWNVPSTAVSGVYFALLEITSGTDKGDASQIPFIVRNDASHSDLVFQTSDPTWEAYNAYGGSDFYTGAANGRAYKISYNRPFSTRTGITAHDYYFANEYPMVRFLERNGYDVTYMAGVDSDRYGSLIKNHKVFLSVGHDEYWSAAQRSNITAARDAGVNLQFLSGNEAYWHTRYEPSADPSHTPYRTLVSYKETWANEKIDPTAEWTGTWRDPRFAPQSQGAGLPENALTGTMYMSNTDDLPVTVSAAEGKLRLWRGTSLANLPAGGSAALAPHTVGYESDEDLDNGFRPAGLVDLSTTVGDTPQYLRDFGSVVTPGTTTHHLTLYRAPSGALVFSAGSIQFTWGLDEDHDTPYSPEPADPRMQQAEVNLFADMGVQPLTLMSGLVAATKSTDTTGPTVSITSPAAGATLANGAAVTVTGTAADVGGGQVAGVEVSTDNGDSWHPASGTTSWSYTAPQHGTGSQTIRVRAVDDSANIGATVSRTISVTCPCSAFGSAVPGTTAADDSSSLELGLRFSPDSDGYITGVRFYKGTGNGGSHVGHLWSSTGDLLATVAFSGETSTGWQTASFATPVPVSAGQSYVVSYTAPQGHYSADANFFSPRAIGHSPFTLPGGYGAPEAGVFAAAGQFPTGSFDSTNYYVDATWTQTDTSPLTVTTQAPLDGSSSVPRSTTVSATFSRPVQSSTAQVTVKDASGTQVAGTTSYDATTRTATFTPSSALAGGVTYTVAAQAKDTNGLSVTKGGTWTFTSAVPSPAAGVCPCSLFGDDTQPTTLEENDSAAVTLGVRFAVSEPGSITAVRFYKGPGNTGTHTGALWSADGTQLATGTFSSESTRGWQTLTFASPVAVSPGQEYYASYRTTVGRYSTGATFSSANLSRGPLVVASDSGAFTYGTGAPTSSTSTNYLVDVVFQRPAATLSITGQSPAPGATAVPRTDPVRVTFSAPVTNAATLTLKNGSTAIAGSSALDAAGTTLTFTPSAALPADTTLTASLANVVSTAGATLADQSWTFRTEAANATAAQTLFGDAVPATPSVNDSSAVEVGTAFSPTRNGVVRAIRFYKGTGNGGTHVGSLWTSSGTRLAQVTFTGETATGWQRAALSSPVAVTAGQTYVVSYLAPQGHYAGAAGYFNSPVTSGQLTAPATNNGRYLYGASGGFPTGSYGATNYYVDVEFVPDAASIAVSGQTPASGATGVASDVHPTATLSAPVAPGYSFTAATGGTAIAGSAALSADDTTVIFTPSALLPADKDITMTLSGVVSQDGATLPTQTWTFHTAAGTSTVTTLFDQKTPSTAAADDSNPVELGVQFSSSVAGQVTSIRFYKGTGNTGTHTGSLWSSTGTRLATGTFTTETATGWQTLVLSTPVSITAGTTYVASYYAPKGHYAATSADLSAAYTQGPITVPASGGVYKYASGGGFPTASWNGSNYFVGVVLRTG